MRLFTHSLGLDLQTSGHIHTPMGHVCRASRCLDSSETLCFCLGPWGTQFTICHIEEDSISGHIGVVVWEVITGREDLHTRLPLRGTVAASQWWSWKREWQAQAAQHPHCTRQYNHYGRQRYRWRAEWFELYSALIVIEQCGIFTVSHLLWQGTSVYNCHLWRHLTPTLFAKRVTVYLF